MLRFELKHLGQYSYRTDSLNHYLRRHQPGHHPALVAGHARPGPIRRGATTRDNCGVVKGRSCHSCAIVVVCLWTSEIATAGGKPAHAESRTLRLAFVQRGESQRECPSPSHRSCGRDPGLGVGGMGMAFLSKGVRPRRRPASGRPQPSRMSAKSPPPSSKRRARHRRRRQRRRHHGLRDRAAGALPGAERQPRPTGEGGLPEARQVGEHRAADEGAAAGRDPLQPRQDARAADRHLPGAPEGVRHRPAEAGVGERPLLASAQAQEGRQGGADRGSPQAAGRQEAGHRGHRPGREDHAHGSGQPQQDELRAVRPAPQGHRAWTSAPWARSSGRKRPGAT